MNPSLVNVSPRRAARVVSRKRAFTLIELLTVIAIIGILATILIPVVGKVRRSASSAKCAAQMRQVGVGLQLFVEDNRGRLPMPTKDGNDFHTGQGPWFDRDDRRLQNHMGRYINSPVASGWGVSNMDFDPHFAWPAMMAESTKGAPSVLLNRKVKFRTSTTEASPWAGVGTPRAPRPLADVLDPSRQQVFIEVDQKNTTAGWRNQIPPGPVHGAYRNALFFDWHVEKLPVNG